MTNIRHFNYNVEQSNHKDGIVTEQKHLIFLYISTTNYLTFIRYKWQFSSSRQKFVITGFGGNLGSGYAI